MDKRNYYQDLTAAAAFFAGRKDAMPILQSFPDWADHSPRDWELLYDEVFRGTNAFWEIPLWASAAFGERVLCNQTTLEVIRYYHRFGYEPARIEGNPPDYVGEQFLFLLHLARGFQKAEDSPAVIQAADDFISTYVLITLRMISRSVSEKAEVFEGLKQYLAELLRLLVREDLPEKLCTEAPYDNDSTAPSLAPLPDGSARVINTGGINNCGGICVIRPTVQEGCILRIESDTDPSHAPQIRACVRGRGYRKTFLNTGRLRYPMRRVGKRGSGHFERISWQEAVEELVQNWTRIRDAYGPASRYLIYGTGVTGIFRPGNLAKRLMSLDGGYLGAFNSYSSACTSYISRYLFGTVAGGHSAADLLNTRFLILWADNTAESIFGPERNYYLSQLKEKGVRIICIDPRLSQTGVAYADEWFAIRPSTDAALADAMAYVIWSEGLQDQAFMDRYCLGFDEAHMPEGVPAGESYHSYLFGMKDGVPKTPEWAENITGIEAERIRKLAREYALAKPACIFTGLGAQRHANGEQFARGIAALCCMTGNLGRSGGSSGGNTSNMSGEHNDIRLFTDRVTNPYPGMIPTFLWSQAIERGTEFTPREDRLTGVDHLDSNIKMILCLASNTLINQHSDVNETIRILEDDSKCEFIVCSDIFMTPSARYADLILPAPSVFEVENIVHSWVGANYFLKNNPVIDPLFECRFEWEWLKEVSEKLGLYDAFTEGKPEARQWLVENYNILREKEPELPDYETFSQLGGWQYKNPGLAIPFTENVEDPDHHPFATPSGKVEIFSKRLWDFGQLEDIPAIPKYVPCPEGPEDKLRERFPLQMIGWHTRRRCHSIHDNNEWQDEVDPPCLWIHPEDAGVRGICSGDTIEVFNDRGRVRIKAVVTDRICKGVTAMSQGGWFTPDKDGVDVRGCINTLTTHRPTPLAKGNPQHTNLVEVRKA